MSRLQNKVAIITGAARGMGAATARIFAANGASVCLTDLLDASPVASELGDKAFALHHDVTDEDRWREVVAATTERFGKVDILINNAGIVFYGESMLKTEKADFERLYGVNVIGAFLGMKHAVPAIIEAGGGAVVNISSIAGQTVINGIAPYAASKWALRALSRTAALEFSPKGVRVNTVFPGTINTAMGNLAEESEEQLASRYAGLPIPRIGRPEEIANASLFLASDESSYMTGAEVVVDGGMISGFYSELVDPK